MAFIHGKKSKFSIDNAAGTLIDISAYCEEVTLSNEIDTAETSTFGSTYKTYVTGLIGASLSVSGRFDAAGATTVDSVLGGILGQEASLTFEYQPSNAAVSVTNPKYTGECICTSYEVSGGVGDMVGFSAEFQITGAVTRATA